MPLIYLAEIVAYDPSVVGTVTLRYASTGWAGAGAPGFYDGRITVPPVIQRTAFAAGTTGGAVETGFGDLTLANPDGGLDGLVDYGFDGRELRILLGDDTMAYGAFVLVMKGTMEQPVFTLDTVSIRVRDRLFELEKPLQPTRYAGTNSGATGQEGTADDIEGRPKPRVWGRVLNVTPPQVNAVQLVYQVNDGAVQDVPAVYEGGLAIGTRGADYTSLSDLTTNAPAAGAYRVWPAGGLFRLGSSPTLPITADVDEGANAAARTAAQLVNRIVTGPGGIAGGDVSASDLTALDAATSAVVGVYVAEETTVRDVVASVASGVGAWAGFDRLGVFRVRRLDAPSGVPVATFRRLDRVSVATATTGDVVDLERLPTADDGRGVPVFRCVLSYARNWTPQTGDQVAAAVTQARRAFLAEPVRQEVATDTTVQTKHLRAGELTRETLLVSQAALATEAARVLDLYKVRRDMARLRTVLDPTLAALVDLGVTVSVEMPRYGYDAGRLMTVIGITTGVEPELRPDLVDLLVWG
ncbi:hypothetical protein UFOVP452_36 [uncultured Caudovirales phage]|uniref:Uncharacterized protein n=1 Tax=uncultured Caudovirales phage TaxID=2100421 RepID=A0A6J5MC64_9CAUD|nr:hypothetical protein UFOVP452_36 [uncultured Caudovirales phage]